MGRAHVIAVNDAWLYAPFAEVLYASDPDWWSVHKGVPSFTGLKYSVSRASASVPGVQVLRQAGREGLELDPTGLRTGHCSGAAALNLAVHFGATRVLLLGYDCGPDSKGKEHFFGAHRGLRNGSPYGLFKQGFATMVQPLKAAGVEVLNCSRSTALECFPRVALETALAAREVAA